MRKKQKKIHGFSESNRDYERTTKWESGGTGIYEIWQRGFIAAAETAPLLSLSLVNWLSSDPLQLVYYCLLGVSININ